MKNAESEHKSYYKANDSFQAIQSANKRISKKNSDIDGQLQRKSNQTKQNHSLKGNNNRKIGSVG